MIKVLELFAGIGACGKALTNLGIEHEIVDAVEIDAFAIKSFNAIHNTNFEPQDICKWDKNVQVDLIMHGSPCQDFSIAGKQAGGDNNSGTRSSLMYETIRIIGKLRPKFIVWENVKNLLSAKHKHNFDNYINTLNALGYNSVYKVLNAKDYGIPQNRERVFTISIRNDVDFKFEFPQPSQLDIRLLDVLEPDVDQKYYIPKEKVLKILNSTFAQEKSRLQEKDVCDTLLARDYKDPKCVQVGELNIKGQDCIKRVYSPDGLSPTLTTMGGGNRQPKIITYNIEQTVKTRKYPVDTERLVELLRTAKNKTGITNEELAKRLNIPLTKVEHWFRKDQSFSIPDAEIWQDLKEILKIADNEDLDKQITAFEEKPGVYEKSNRVYDAVGISPTITKTDADLKIVANKNIQKAYAVAMRGRYNEKGKVEQQIEPSDREIANTVTTVQKDSMVGVIIDDTQGFDGVRIYPEHSPTLRAGRSGLKTICVNPKVNGKQPSLNNRVYSTKGISTCIATSPFFTGCIDDNHYVRKLTPKECWRLMGFADQDYENAEKVNSNSQLYKQAGNSIVVNVLMAILGNLFTKQKE